MKNKSLVLVLYFSPFLNIVSYRAGEEVAFCVLITLLVFSFIRSPKLGNVTRYEKRMLKIDIMYLVMVCLLMILSLSFGVNNLYYVRFYGIMFGFVLYLHLVQGKYFYYDGLLSFLRYLIVIVFLSICIDALLMSMGLDIYQPMYDPEKYTYLNRPFGIFGQPSVNSSLLCFFYIFQRALLKRLKTTQKKDWFLVMVIAGCIIQGSGSGFVSLVFVLISKLNKQKATSFKIRKIMPLIVLIVVIFICVVRSNVIDKVSMVYIDEMVDYTLIELWHPYLASIKDYTYVLFGVPDTDISIDLGPLFIIATVGILFFLVLMSFFIYILRNSNDFDLKLGLWSLLIANIHYPVMFYFVMNFLWYFVVYHILVVEKVEIYERQKNMRCYVNVRPQP